MFELHTEKKENLSKAQELLKEAKERDKKMKKKPFRIDKNTVVIVTAKRMKELRKK